MPLTFPVHQLAVLPLVRGGSWPLSGSALVIGSALPDMAFVIGGYPLNHLSHQALGPLVFAPTLGLLLYAWWVAVLAPALAASLPAEGTLPVARLCVTRGLPRRASGWLWSVLALVIGAYLHLLFDGFTHANMWPANVLYPDVRLHLGGEPLLVSRFLQIATSIVGTAVVLAWTWRFIHAAPPQAPTPARRRRLGILVSAVVAGAAAGLVIGLAVLGWPEGKHALVLLVLSPTTAGALAGATLGAWLTRRQVTVAASASEA